MHKQIDIRVGNLSLEDLLNIANKFIPPHWDWIYPIHFAWVSVRGGFKFMKSLFTLLMALSAAVHHIGYLKPCSEHSYINRLGQRYFQVFFPERNSKKAQKGFYNRSFALRLLPI